MRDEEATMRTRPYYTRKVIGSYPASLKGLGQAPLRRQRGLKGGTLGPASPGRSLSKEEREAVVVDLRESGVLTGEAPKPTPRLTRKEYWEYLQSTAWEAVKIRFFAANPAKVCDCCATDKGLFDLHHKTYARLGCERLTDLCLVCRECHQSIHDLADENDWSIAEATAEWRKIAKKLAEENLPW